MKDLESLTVSGGDISDISYVNLDAIVDLQKLTYLELHEFGAVDLRPLKRMKQLRKQAETSQASLPPLRNPLSTSATVCSSRTSLTLSS